MSYDAKTDYMALMQQAAAQGDYKKAAEYEQARNAKIQGEGITQYKPTSDYAGNLDSTDYSIILQQQMSGGADANTVRDTLDKRVSKANSAKNLKQYAYDDKYKQAMEYIKRTPPRKEVRSATSQNDYIDKLYEAQQEAALAKLKAAYEQNMIDVDAAADKIPQMYQSARNKTAATSEQNRAAFNERAAAYGLNSGTGGQADLAMRNQNASNMSAINTQEAGALKDLETTRLKISTGYQNDIAQAVAQGDLARAQALYNEAIRVDNSLVQQSMAQADEDYRYWAANNQQQQQTQQQEQYKLAQQQWLADALAKYGVFSGYDKFGVTPADQAAMKAAYNAANFRSGGGGTRRSSSGGGRRGGNSGGGNYAPPPPPSVTIPKSIDYQVGMNRTKTGQKSTINRLYDTGKISEAQANALYDKFKIDS